MAVIGCLVGAFSLGLTACGDDDEETAGDAGGGGGGAKTVKVYSSLPLQGASEAQTKAMVNGIELALEEAGGKAGETTVEYESLDDSTAQAGSWEPGRVNANARKAAQDDTAVAYIGEFNSGASALSIPILSEAKLAQVSPANTAVGLTTDEPGADTGEPDKYYPGGFRNYARIVPKDTIQGAALATVMKEEGCKAVYILNDKEVYGAGLAKNIEASAKEQGLEVAGNDGIDPKAANFRSVAAKVKSDCAVFSGITANGAAQLFKDLAASSPSLKLFGPDGVAESGFVDPKEGGIPDDVGKRTLLSVATLSPDEYPPEGQKFFQDFEAKFNEPNPDPYAIYGYEAMQLVLDAVKRAGDKASDREEVVKQIFATKGRESVLGTYDIDENGDTTLSDYGIYKVEKGELAFDRTVKAAE